MTEFGVLGPPPELSDDLTRSLDAFVGTHPTFPGWILVHLQGRQVRPDSAREMIVYQTLLSIEQARILAARILQESEWVEQNTVEPSDPS